MARKKKTNKTRHNDLARAVIDAIELTNVALVWKMQSGLFKDMQNKCIGNIGIPGVPDICGIAKDGRFLGIEIKVLPDKLNPNQIDFNDFCDDVGALYITFTDRDDMDELIERLKKVRRRPLNPIQSQANLRPD